MRTAPVTVTTTAAAITAAHAGANGAPSQVNVWTTESDISVIGQAGTGFLLPANTVVTFELLVGETLTAVKGAGSGTLHVAQTRVI